MSYIQNFVERLKMHHDHKIEYSKKNYYFYFMDDCNRLFK